MGGKRQLTNEDFLKKVYEKNEYVKNGYIEIRGKYINSKTPVRCYCKKHDFEWDSVPAVLYQWSGCRLCAKEMASVRYMMPHEDFLKKLYETNEAYRRGDFSVTGTYKGAGKPIECFCNIHNELWNPIPNNLYKGYACPTCGLEKRSLSSRIPHDVFMARVFESNEHVRNGEIEIRGIYDGMDNPIECYCVKHKILIYPTPYSLQNGGGCKYCAGNSILVGFNDLHTTDPQVAALLTNPADGYLVTRMSHAKKNFTCPLCGKKQDKIVMNVTRRGLQCDNCSDHISYPNRFSMAFFGQLPVDNYTREYSPSWLLPYSYDNYFEYNGRCFVVENDAGLGHGNKQWGPGNKKDVDGKKRDEFKDGLAKEHDVYVIRIDTQESTCEYIKQHILDSELAQIFDLSNIDWEKCDRDAQKNLIKEVCNLYMSTTKDLQTIADIVQLGTQCVRNYLKKGAGFGWCDYDPKISYMNRKKNNKATPVILISEQTGQQYIFDSASDCERNMLKICGFHRSYSMIRKYCRENLLYGGFYFGYVDIATQN